jgi:D-alanyl-D-alanine carboxypeptidase
VTRRRRAVGRVPVALVAVVVGIAVLAAGFVRGFSVADAGPAGSGAIVGPVGSALLVAPSGVPSRSASASVPDASNPPPSSQPSASPSSAAPSLAPGVSPGPGLAALNARLQSTLDRVGAKLAIPGVSATVLFPDGSSWTGASGLANVGAKKLVTADTAFAYASISKTFTSAVILQLVGEGRIRLSDSAASLLPPLAFRVDPAITVAMLLDHTSGLADYFLNPKIDKPLQARPSATWTADDALAFVGKRRSPPGKAWHYANTNYLLLGLIVERATGQSLGAAIRNRLLDPIGLARTWYQVDETSVTELAHGYRLPGTKPTVRPVDLDDGSGLAPFRSVVTAAGGAGAMAGTSGDLARWARALYRGDVLGPSGTALLLSDFTKATAYLRGVTYGYGVQALSVDGHPSLGHSGRLLGFRSAVRHFPLDGITIAVLTNQSRADPAAVVRALLKVALPASVCTSCPPPG